MSSPQSTFDKRQYSFQCQGNTVPLIYISAVNIQFNLQPSVQKDHESIECHDKHDKLSTLLVIEYRCDLLIRHHLLSSPRAIFKSVPVVQTNRIGGNEHTLKHVKHSAVTVLLLAVSVLVD